MVCAAFSMSWTADPFQPRMERVLAGEDVGAGQPHERQPRAVGAAADRALHRLEAGAADRLDRVVDDLGVTVDHLLHVAVLRLDLHPVGRARIVLHHVLDDALEQGFFFLQAFVGEIAHDEADRGFLQRAGDADRMQKTLLALGGLRRAGVFRQPVDDGGGDLDGVLHLALGEAGMGADALDGDGGAVGRKRLVLDIPGGLAVDRVGEIGAELLQVDLVDAAADLFIGREQDLDARRA